MFHWSGVQDTFRNTVWVCAEPELADFLKTKPKTNVMMIFLTYHENHVTKWTPGRDACLRSLHAALWCEFWTCVGAIACRVELRRVRARGEHSTIATIDCEATARRLSRTGCDAANAPVLNRRSVAVLAPARLCAPEKLQLTSCKGAQHLTSKSHQAH